jgi:disulfide bond formation protein DsbB
MKSKKLSKVSKNKSLVASAVESKQTETPWIERILLYVAWIQAAAAMAGSLYFSEIAHFPPCLLCWYQRIVMYPLVAIIPVGILRRDKGLPLYVLPLSIIGMLIAGYHNLLYWKIIPESDAPCQLGVSCTSKFIEWFGFVTIPLLSFAAFTLITVCMILYWKITHPRKQAVM